MSAGPSPTLAFEPTCLGLFADRLPDAAIIDAMSTPDRSTRLTIAKLLIAMTIIGAGVAYVVFAGELPREGWTTLSFDVFRIAGLAIVGAGILSLFTPQLRRPAMAVRLAGTIVVLWALLIWHMLTSER